MTQIQHEDPALSEDAAHRADPAARDERFQADGAERTRTYSWTDPTATFEALAGRSGLDLLSAIGRGELPPPPIMATLGVEPVEFGPGRAVFALDPAQARLTDSRDRLLAHATSTCLLFSVT